MAFEDVEIVTRTNRPTTATISFMRPVPKKKKVKAGDPVRQTGDYDRTKIKPVLVIWMPTKITGTTTKEHFQLKVDWVGRKIRIVGVNAANKSTVPMTLMKWSSRFNFGYLPALADEDGDAIADKDEVPVRQIDKDTFELDAPAWFKKVK